MVTLEKKKSVEFPKGFFTQPRPTVSMKEALKDVVPIKWSSEVKSGKKKTILYSPKEKKVL